MQKQHAAFYAIEILIWQLVRNGMLRSAPLAAELQRYAGFSDDARGALQILALVAKAAAIPDLVEESGDGKAPVAGCARISSPACPEARLVRERPAGEAAGLGLGVELKPLGSHL